MKLRSHIAYPAFCFQKYNSRKELLGIVTTSALFDVDEQGVLRDAPTQRPIQLSDEYSPDDGAPPALVRTADFAPYRPATDVTALARAVALSDQPSTSWLVGLMVGQKTLVLRVHGPRYWHHSRWHGWQLSEPEPATSVMLDYRAAYGGPFVVPDGHPKTGEVDIWNPIGPGVLTADTPTDRPVAAPQIELADDPIINPFKAYKPQSFAPIAPVWRHREQYAGTYDETWIKTQHPFLPPDFDPQFYNVAHPQMRFAPFLRGDELIRTANMFPGRPDLAFYLPAIAFGAVATHGSGLTVRSPLALDGVHLELLGVVPQVRLTWRTSFPWRDGINTMDIGPLEFQRSQQAGADA
ncbi:MAG: hypothetical protein RLZZ437_24 [Pseudomonadota bacterium]|jgi:hypothetical protein